jgi:hypothetical protein
MIPEKFCIAGRKEIVVIIEDTLLNNSGSSIFGYFDDVKNIIKIARKVKSDDEWVDLTPEDIERTYYHELGHVYQFYNGLEMTETGAQAFSNFLFEYMNTKV